MKYTDEDIKEFERTFKEMKKKQAWIVGHAEDKGYEYLESELSVMIIIGQANSWKDISPSVERYFLMTMYPKLHKLLA